MNKMAVLLKFTDLTQGITEPRALCVSYVHLYIISMHESFITDRH